ncbi:MAG: fluoride efflux transporter CrcB [Gammaproteobacteria bacterium]|nr:fluoride efflux transporter CrcB [Gammaproteobacteria bacterium]MBQ0840601.1 fluoride efflux transporter CrcB [Gammaproteobacteria bacterium]
MQWLAVALGGALGAMGRYGVGSILFPVEGSRFPLSTLVVNVLGSLLMGVLYVVIVEKSLLSGQWRELLMIGFLGAFTTYSTFSLDALALWQNGHLALALFYVVITLFLCLGGTFTGLLVTRLF